MKLPWKKPPKKENELPTTTKVRKLRKVKYKLKKYIFSITIAIYIVIGFICKKLFFT